MCGDAVSPRRRRKTDIQHRNRAGSQYDEGGVMAQWPSPCCYGEPPMSCCSGRLPKRLSSCQSTHALGLICWQYLLRTCFNKWILFFNVKLLFKLCKSFWKISCLPCASSYQSLPVVTPTVNIDISHHTIAALAGETVLAVAFLRCGFIPLHREVIVWHLQLLMSWFGV